MNAFEQYEVWYVTGAQLLYGGDAVIAVDAHSNEMVTGLNDSGKLPVKVVYKGTVNSSKEVTAAFKAANNDEKCIGVITWMHTFSPCLLYTSTVVSWTNLLLYSERKEASSAWIAVHWNISISHSTRKAIVWFL